MKLYSAIDLHSNNNVLTILDEEDRVTFEKKLPNHLPTILAQLEPYREGIQAIAVESTFNWYWLVDGLMEAGYAVKLVNTVAVKTYDGLKYSSDAHDARHLAHLLRLGILPTGHICPKDERGVRDLLRKRAQLVRYRTAQGLSIQNLVNRNTGRGITMRKIRELDGQIRRLEAPVLERAKLKPGFEILKSVPGIGDILGLTIMYEAGDMGRFETVGRFASYARCVSSSRWSNGKKKGEGNRKNGNKFLAWAFVEAANYAVRYNERVHRFHQRKKAKTKKVIAVKAVAHKLARACYHMLKEGVRFDEARAFA